MNTREFNALLIKSIATGKVTTNLPSIFQQGIRYTDLKRSQLATLGEPVIFNGKTVIKLQLIKASASDTHPPRDYLLIHHADTMTPYIIHSRMTTSIQAAFTLLGAKEETIFLDHRLPVVNWLRRSQREVYVKECELSGNNSLVHHYHDLHERLVNRINSIIQSQPQTKFNIVDGGCGDGSLLKRVQEENLPVKLAGFDVNAINIMHASMNETINSTSVFKTGNLLMTDKIIAGFIAEGKLHGGQATTIMVLSGSLTRRVLNNTYQALAVFTAIARQSSIQYVIGGGINQPLINRQFAKHMGFKQTPLSESAHEYDFCFERMPRQVFVELKLEKMRAKKLVDLSFCPDDAMLTSLLPHITHDMTIDLSFCHYTKELEYALAMTVKQNPTIKIIMQHTDAAILKQFNHRFKSSANIISMQQVSTNNELYLFNTYRKLPRYSFFDQATQTAKAPVAPFKLVSRL